MQQEPQASSGGGTEEALCYVPAGLVPDEEARQQTLDNYGVLGTEAEQSYDDLTQLAAAICEAPIAQISLIDKERQWIKSSVGLQPQGAPREWSFCAHAILRPDELLEVPDTLKDPRFAGNPLVLGGPRIRFYAGVPLVSPGGVAFGAICVIDRQPRTLTIAQHQALQSLARQTVAQLELRLTVRNLKQQTAEHRLVSSGSKKLQTHLEGSEHRFRLLAEASSDIIVLLDLDGNRSYVSPAVMRILGWKPEEMTGSSYHQLAHPDDVMMVQQLFDDCRNGAPARMLEYRCRKFDGSYTWLEMNARLVHDPDTGAATGFVAVGRDISLRKVNEEERKRAFELVERNNQQLAESTTAALRASQAKSEFLSRMSHEMRTPMNGVLGMNQLLLGTSLSPEQRRYVEVAQSSGRTLLALIDDLLDLAKIEAGKVVMEFLDFDLRHAITDIVEIWSIQAAAKGLTFSSSMAADLPTFLRGDPNRLRQVLNNLAANSIKFTERGEVSLAVDVAGNQGGRVVVRFSFADTGIGIRPDQASHLFSPFVQADVSTTRNYGGTGLGLAICKNLVELMGGTIGMESRIGEGSTFWFTVSFETAASAPPASGEGTVIRSHPARAMRILVAEDNQINRLVVLSQLKKLGYPAKAVVDGVEAVKAIAGGEFDLVLMDCEMPVMDGFEATRRIRESRQPRIPIIAVTAHAMSGDRDRCIAAGMDDFISKPLDMQLLSQMLAKWSGQDAKIVEN